MSFPTEVMGLRVFDFRKKKSYVHATLPAIRGESRGVEIEFKNYPVRIADEPTQKRTEYFTDFNVYLMDAIWSAIGDYSMFAARALLASVQLPIIVTNAPAFFCEIRLKCAKTEREFAAELPDAIIEAFKSNDIGR
jgi:hypothetical protein